MARGSLVGAQRVVDMIQTVFGSLGVLAQDGAVVEIMVNPDGRVWIERVGLGMQMAELVLSVEERLAIIELVAGAVNLVCHAQSPRLSATIAQWGLRFQGFIPPATMGPCFTIRKPAMRVFTLAEYAAEGILTVAQAQTLQRAVRARVNMLIVGSTGSGKTTLLNAVLADIATLGERLITIEDMPELQCTAPNHLALYVKEDVAPMQHLVKDTLRCRPDRIILGEVRGAEAVDLVDSWNTGHAGGLCTVHANSCREALTRMETLIRRSNIPTDVARQLLGEAKPLLVYIARTATGRVVQEIVRVAGVHAGEYTFVEF